jgi:hypothetical protein
MSDRVEELICSGYSRFNAGERMPTLQALEAAGLWA